MELPLFRRQVTERQGERLYGELILRQPLSFKLLSCLLIFITVTVALFLWFNDYPRSEQVTGFLLPKQGMIPVAPSRTGLVTALHVTEGEQVSQNQALLSLRADLVSAKDESLSESLVSRLKARQLNLRQRIALERQSLVHLEQMSIRQETYLEREISTLESLYAGEEELLDLKNNEIERVRAVFNRGIAAGADLDVAREQFLRQENAAGNYSLRLLEKLREHEISRVRSQAEKLEIDKEILRLESQLQELEQQVIRHGMEARHQIKAPIAGRVGSVSVKVGQQLVPAQNILTLLPADYRLQAELLIPSRAIGFLKTGQEVLIRFEAFPYQKFGVFSGEITSVSEALTFAGNSEPAVQQPDHYYRVTASLPNQTIRAYGQEYPLKAGMKLHAELILEQRRLVDWLLDTLLSAQGKR